MHNVAYEVMTRGEVVNKTVIAKTVSSVGG